MSRKSPKIDDLLDRCGDDRLDANQAQAGDSLALVRRKVILVAGAFDFDGASLTPPVDNQVQGAYEVGDVPNNRAEFA